MDILAIGEPLMELSESTEGQYVSGFGGDTSNFIIAASRQGASTAYQTAVGSDTFGSKFLKLWRQENVNTDLVRIDPEHHTGLYFISYGEQGHEFTYHREGSAASYMSGEFINEKVLNDFRYIHVSGISQAISNSACDAIYKAILIAQKNGTVVTYDPNLRLKLWPLERAKAIIHNTLQHVDIFLPSLDDVTHLTGLDNPEKIVDYYLDMGLKMVVLKLGREGCIVATPEKKTHIPGFIVDSLDATGAGDTFDGAFVAQLSKGKSPKTAAQYANAAAALSTQGIGAVTPIPSIKQVEQFLLEQSIKF
ncbi:sugar kinase [Psychrobacillus sp. FSL K6-2836]|uniref:sugar kinase n=1 Tax=Psychrobacillus sp. FSL K6-2836 TaxID=2921548 RepID=UPI0030F6D9FD